MRNIRGLLFVTVPVCVLFLTLANGCAWSGPYPAIVVNTEGLGQGQIAKYLNGSWMNSDKWIADKVKEMFITENKNKAPRSSAESIGMHCDIEPSKVCKYTGFVQFNYSSNASVAQPNSKSKVAHISIIVRDYNEIDSIVVRKTESFATE